MTNTTLHKTPETAPQKPASRREKEERPVRELPPRPGRVSAGSRSKRCNACEVIGTEQPPRPVKVIGPETKRPYFLPTRTRFLNRRARTAPLGWARRVLPMRAHRAKLEWQYRLRMQIGLIAALLIVIAFVRMPLNHVEEAIAFTAVGQDVIQMEEIVQTQHIRKPPPPPPPPVPIAVPNEEIIVGDDLDLDATIDIDEPLVELPPPALLVEEVQEEDPEPEIFMVVEEQPEIIGGMERLYELLEYPKAALRTGKGGMVIVQIIIGPDGSPRDPEVIRSAGALLDEAAVKAIMQLRFTPGRQRGKPVHVKKAFPVRFKFVDKGRRTRR